MKEPYDQTKGELCDKCGWAMKFPSEPCRCELELEVKALHSQLEHYKMLLDEARDHLNREIMEVNALRADKARLDWLEKHHLTLAAMKERWSEEIMLWWQVADGERSLSGHPLSSPRAAIDAARKKAKL